MLFAFLPDGASNGSDSKKLRVEEAPPSRVLHIRKLPNEATETEIIALGLPFGKVTNILTLKGKNQVRTADSKPASASWCQPVEPGGWAGGCALTAALSVLCLARLSWRWAPRRLPSPWSTTTPLSPLTSVTSPYLFSTPITKSSKLMLETRLVLAHLLLSVVAGLQLALEL